MIVIPLRLLDCFGLLIASAFTPGVVDALVVVDGRLGAVLVLGLGTGAVGLLKKAEGEGMLIVAMIHRMELLCVLPETRAMENSDVIDLWNIVGSV